MYIVVEQYLMSLGRSECASGEREVKLVKQYSNNAHKESFKLYKGRALTPNLIFKINGEKTDDYKEYAYFICIKPEQNYTVEYGHYDGPWPTGSYVRMFIEGTIIYEGSLGGNVASSDTFMYHECTSPDALTTISVQYADYSQYQYFSLTCDNGTHVSEILTVGGIRNRNNKFFSYSFCYGPNKQYNIFMQTTSEAAWEKNSFVQVTRGDEVIIKTFMDYSRIGADFFYYHPPCTSSEIEATVTRYYGSKSSGDESFDVYKGDVESGVVVFHGKGEARSNFVTSAYPICIEPEQKYSIVYHSKNKDGWSKDNNRGFSNVKISIGDALLYGGHMASGGEKEESFVYRTACAENEIEATVRRRYGSYPLYEPFRVFKGEVDEGNHVLSLYGNSEDQNQTRVYSMCIEKGQEYSTLYYTSHDDGWTNNGVYESSVSITDGNNLLESGSLSDWNSGYSGSFSYPRSCKSNEIPATLVRQYGDLAHREYFELFKGEEENDSFLFGIYGMNDDIDKALNYTICIEQNSTYIVNYGSDDMKTWNSNSNIDIQYLDITLFHNSYHNTTIPSETFTVNLPTCAADDEWKETVIGQQATASCQSSDYEGQRERMCNSQNMAAVWGPIMDKCTLKAPVISYSQSSYNFTKAKMIDEIVPLTKNRVTLFAIKPSLPDGLFFNTTTGSISGTPMIDSPPTMYTVTASNEERSATTIIRINIYSIACKKEGVWNSIDFGKTAYAYCENSNAVQYRECLLKDSEAYWGEIHDEMCRIRILPGEPEKDHVFIQFACSYSEKEPESYTALNLFALYSSLYDYFDGNHMNVDGITISIDSASLANEQKDGSVIRWSIGVLESEAEIIKEGLTDYLKTAYYKDVMERDPSFGNVPFEFNQSDMVIVHSPALSPIIIVIIIIIVIGLFALIIGVVVLKLRRRSKMIEDHYIRFTKGV